MNSSPIPIALLFFCVWLCGCGPSLSQLQTRAGAGDAEAQYRLGWSYDSGSIYNSSGRSHCPMDPVEAVKWFRKAADQGHAYAQLHLGVMYESGRGVRQDDKEAAKWWRMAVAEFGKAAKTGNPQEQISLGLMHANGRGVETNLIAAYAWYNIAELYRSNDAKQLKRNLVTEGMTPDQIDEAGELTKEIIEENPDMLRPERAKQLLKQLKAKGEKKFKDYSVGTVKIRFCESKLKEERKRKPWTGYGVDGGFPETVVSSLEITANSGSYSLPVDMVNDLGNPNIRHVNVRQNGKLLELSMANSDRAGGHFVLFQIDIKKAQGRRFVRMVIEDDFTKTHDREAIRNDE